MTGEQRIKAVVIGASAGAVEALSGLLPALPAKFGLPVFIVVHVPPNRDSIMAELFQAKCKVGVTEARDKEPIEMGTVYLAPPNYHLLVEQNQRLSLSSDDQVLYSRPSIDVLFESAADAYGSGLLGIVLTGANSDGARGLRAVCDAGGVAIVQDPATAQAKAMPTAALDACPNATTMSLASIAEFLGALSAEKNG